MKQVAGNVRVGFVVPVWTGSAQNLCLEACMVIWRYDRVFGQRAGSTVMFFFLGALTRA